MPFHLQVKTRSVWEQWEPVTPDRPAPRTGHVCVTFEDQIIVYDDFLSYVMLHSYIY